MIKEIHNAIMKTTRYENRFFKNNMEKGSLSNSTKPLVKNYLEKPKNRTLTVLIQKFTDNRTLW